ncbi:serine/threonine-protein kinase [Streptomyces sp. NPDC020681]|uniref:serine/threonine-protein kinase n=1 Tax=Streptomyces sp. NPDC020681 TaxID=3365083 RepID=UPI0037AA3A4D
MQRPGDVIDGRFELIERLGSGGMGTVWRARDTVLHREVALKAVRPDAEASNAVRERVLREARALARLSHPHVVMIHQIVDVDAEPHPWIVMELITGVSLKDRLDRGPLAPVEAARIGRQVLSALRAAHAAGIQHRDVKPANVLLRADGSAVLTDFGIAALQGTTSLTATGELVGSPEYMAPERVRGRDDDPASDFWSLGLVLYVCVEGISPLRRSTTFATLAAVLDDPVPPPVRSGPLAPVLRALLVRDAASRPDAERLDSMLAQVESGATPYWEQPTMTTGPGGGLASGPGGSEAPTQARRPAAGHGPGGPGGPHSGGHTEPQPPQQRRSRTPVLIAVISVAVAVIAATAVVLALRGSGEDNAGGTAGPSGSTTSPPGASSTPPSPTPTPTPTPSEPPPTSGRWIAQLFSEPVDSGTGVREQRLDKIRQSIPQAVLLRTDDYASLRPGFWVIYAPGPFADGRAVLNFCAQHGRTSPNTCIGRYLSTSSADYSLQCHPPANNPVGRCTRS